MTETSVALTASYGVMTKILAVNFGLWQVETVNHRTTTEDARLGTGLSYLFWACIIKHAHEMGTSELH